jgi:hypothetical protein
MILWLSVVAGVVLTAVAAIRMWREDRATRDRRGHDAHWGDWPPDQMSI